LAILRPREGGLRLGKIFGCALLQPARSVCVYERFFIAEISYKITWPCWVSLIICQRLSYRNLSNWQEITQKRER